MKKVNDKDIAKKDNIEAIEKEFDLKPEETKKRSITKKIGETKFAKKISTQIWPLLLPFMLVMVFLVILPLIGIIVYSIIQPTNDSLVFRISLENFVNLFANSALWMAIGLSILYAFIASVLSLVFAYPIALMMSKVKNKVLQQNIWVLVTMPIWISMILKVLGLKSVFYLLAPTAIGTPIAVIIGMIYMYLPFAISPIYNALTEIDPAYHQAALDLGSSRNKAFWDITFRQSIPGVITAFSLVIVQAATSLLVVRYMGDGKINLIASIIESYFFKGTNFGYGAAISVVLAALIFILIFVLKLLSNKFETRRSRRWKTSSDPVTSLS